MFNIGDYVLNQESGCLGKVVGYSHAVSNGAYVTTLKVLVDHAGSSGRKGFVEDLYSAWTACPQT